MRRALIDVTQAVVCSFVAGYVYGFVEGFAARWRGVPVVLWFNYPPSASEFWSGAVINLALFAALMIPISLRRNRSSEASGNLSGAPG
jgi:hypothetical protein